MSLLDLAWQFAGAILGLWIGRQILVLALKYRRQLNRDTMSYREYRQESLPFNWWAIGLTFLFLIDVLIFGFTPSTLGLIAGVPFGYFLRKTWRIDEDEPPLAKAYESDEYPGD